MFTYALIEGLKGGKAGRPQGIRAQALQEYVGTRVKELTAGRQNPTMRHENLENNFVVY